MEIHPQAPFGQFYASVVADVLFWQNSNPPKKSNKIKVPVIYENVYIVLGLLAQHVDWGKLKPPIGDELWQSTVEYNPPQ